MSAEAWSLLPADLQAVACRRDNEWGWPPDLIPRVIEEARQLSLLNVGGQLQFRPDGKTCECYWVSVDPLDNEPIGLDWRSRVEFAAEAALRQFEDLRRNVDFVAEVRKGFADVLSDYESAGHDPSAVMCFIWYLDPRSTDPSIR